MKNPLSSKTLWSNVVLFLALKVPAIKDLVTPEFALQVVMALNFVLRLITKSELKLPWNK
jgi:hypothetical protein